MKSCKVRRIEATLIKTIKVLRKESKDKSLNRLLTALIVFVKKVFYRIDDLPELTCKIKNVVKVIEGTENMLDEYTSLVLISILNRTIASLNIVYGKYNQEQIEDVKIFSKGSFINSNGYSALNSYLKEREYNDFVLDNTVLTNNIAFLPMFLEIVKKDKNKLLSDFIDCSGKYVYGIMNNGSSDRNLIVTDTQKSNDLEHSFIRSGICSVEEYTNSYNSYYLFRITKSCFNAAMNIYMHQDRKNFTEKHVYETKTALLRKKEVLMLAEIYMRAVEKEEPVVVHLKSYSVFGLHVDKL